MRRWILQSVGACINLIITNDVVGNKLSQADGSIRVQRKTFVRPNRDVFRCLAIAWSSREQQFIDLSSLAVARLIKAYATIDEWIVDDDLLAQDYPPILHNRQIGPPPFRGAVGIVLLP